MKMNPYDSIAPDPLANSAVNTPGKRAIQDSLEEDFYMEAPKEIYIHIRKEPCPSITFSEEEEKNCENIKYIRADLVEMSKMDKLEALREEIRRRMSARCLELESGVQFTLIGRIAEDEELLSIIKMISRYE